MDTHGENISPFVLLQRERKRKWETVTEKKECERQKVKDKQVTFHLFVSFFFSRKDLATPGLGSLSVETSSRDKVLWLKAALMPSACFS